MDSYNLAPGEFVVLQETSWLLWENEDGVPLKELVLTNKHLILVNEISQGLFKRTTMLKRCPLEQLVDQQGSPMLVVSKLSGKWWVQASFGSEVIRLRDQAGTRRGADHWADALRKAAIGDYAAISPDPITSPELSQLVDGARNIFGSIAGGIGAVAPSPKTGAEAPTMVNAQCPSCHAPLSGRKGSLVTCSYCDTKTTL